EYRGALRGDAGEIYRERVCKRPDGSFPSDRYAEEIKNMDGFGEKSYENLQNSVDNARTTTLPRLVYSLGIPNIGIANAKVICRALGNDPERVMNATAEELDEIPGVGDVIAKAYVDYFADEE